MNPRISVPLAVLALLSGSVLASAQKEAPAAPTITGPQLSTTAKPRPISGHGAPQSQLPDPAGGKLSLESSTFDAGRIERGGKISHSFIVKNTGTGPLNIDAKPG